MATTEKWRQLTHGGVSKKSCTLQGHACLSKESLLNLAGKSTEKPTLTLVSSYESEYEEPTE